VIDPNLPATVYLDTSAVVTALFPGLAHSTASATFCTSVAQGGGGVVFSQVLWLEFSQALVKLALGTELPAAERRRHRFARWGRHVDVREQWYRFGLDELEAFLGRFAAVTEVEFRREIWLASLDVMARTQLRSHDAVHVATAREVGVRDFVTVDDHFRRVPDLRVWLMRDSGP
jgi:predicted nucleic acid-binding protein